jgi:hypothetical protein
VTYEEAVRRVALAGREIGGGPASAVEELLPGLVDRLVCEEVACRDALQRRAPSVPPLDLDEQCELAGRVAYGVAVGLVMAEHPATMAQLGGLAEQYEILRALGWR